MVCRGCFKGDRVRRKPISQPVEIQQNIAGIQEWRSWEKMIRTCFIVFIILLMPSMLYAGQNLPAVHSLEKKPPHLAIARPICLEGKQDARVAGEIEEVMKLDLNLAGCFRVTSDLQKVDSGGIEAGEFDFRPWRSAGAALLLKSGYIVDGDKVLTDFRLYDVSAGKQLWSAVYTGKRRFVREMAHAFSDDTMRVVTGEEGPFTGKIAFVSTRTGNKEVYMMDYDGFNVTEITRNGSINLNPAFSPDRQNIIYTSYRSGNPDLYIRRIFSGKEAPISSRTGLNITGAWAPHGDRIALAMSKDGNTQIYLIDRKGREISRLTNDDAIDISPSWSPDGSHIAFVSDREGTPQIYIMNADGTDIKMVTKSGDYNVGPSWSPKGDRILYSRMESGGFQIYSIKPDGSGDTRLTTEGRNEYPHWSPDGRFITFTSNRDGKESIYVMRGDGTSQIKVSRGKGGDSQPVWSQCP
jgi:TolB protein